MEKRNRIPPLLPPSCRAKAVLRLTRVVADLARAESFYRDALGFHRIHSGRSSAAPAGLAGEQLVLCLGAQQVALVCPDTTPPPPPASRANDLWFQHLAIVVSDMDGAYAALMRHRPRPISIGGPQLLPPANGAVVAFKFRDPDGHPLELIHFPPGQGRAIWQTPRDSPFLGIDHSALAVSETDRSLAFYRGLGFDLAATSINQGPVQSRLDGLDDAHVRVSSLRPPDIDSMGLELLGYTPPGNVATGHVANWTTLLVPGSDEPKVAKDPDGHVMLLVSDPS